MEMFCDGFSQKEIREKLAKRGIRRRRETIHAIIKKHLILYGLYAIR